ncbi:MAG: protein translocase subunit SecF [Candidatus Pacebacteria bacterium]|nr:protein translocase subunit SecF [Candidatus Paceibacterota bacterium]
MNFLKYKWFYFLISALFLVPGFYSLVRWGLEPAIDFAGGTILEYEQKTDQGIEIEKIKKVLDEKEFSFDSVQISGEKKFVIKGEPAQREKVAEIKTSLEEVLATELVEIRFEAVGPSLGKELLWKTIAGIILASIGILIYVAWRFKDRRFGVGAVLAMFHDSLILLGSFSLLGHFYQVEVDTLFVTAVLTTLSFSVHDTVVVFDSIRENRNLYPQANFDDLANQAIAKTIVRSFNNSLTIIFMLIALLLMGGATIRWFVAALLIGTIAGTFSSTFTAVPLLSVWENFKQKRTVKNKARLR